MKHGGGTQRWLVSYADMVTLLFALFLVLFAVSSVDNSRLVELADALDKQLWDAAQEGDVAKIKRLVAEGASPSAKSAGLRGAPWSTPSSAPRTR